MSGVVRRSLSLASVALLAAGILLAGALLGSLATAWGDPQPSATPIALQTPPPSVPASVAALPAADVAGEDLARLPRYPGSVRTAHKVSRDERYRLTATEYLADAVIDDVRAFYQGVIAEHGWERADISHSDGTWAYVLVDGRTEALIEIEMTGGLVEIDLQVSEPLPGPTPAPTPVPAAPPPPPAPPPDDDDDDDDDGSDDDSGEASDD